MDTGEFSVGELELERGSARGTELLKRGLSVLHESLADYILTNPGATLREIGAYFGYTPAWICTVINTDMFKAYLEQRRGDIEVAVASGLPKKLMAAGHLATERLIEVLEKTNDSDTIVDCFDKVLHRLGYAPGSRATTSVGTAVVQQQNNYFTMSKEDFRDAKGAFLAAHERVVEVDEPPLIPPAPFSSVDAPVSESTGPVGDEPPVP